MNLQGEEEEEEEAGLAHMDLSWTLRFANNPVDDLNRSSCLAVHEVYVFLILVRKHL